ncbi:hypothetical protein AB6A40_001469, partial [Gnathostoma spinigerum]
KSGPLLCELIRSSESLKGATVEKDLVADEIDQISQSLLEFVPKVDVILTTGGTGFAPRDVTPEATNAVIEKRCGGLETALHLRSLQATPLAALSRLCAGIKDKTLIINLPGSPKAVKECFEVVEKIIPHAVHLIRDDKEFICGKHTEIAESF